MINNSLEENWNYSIESLFNAMWVALLFVCVFKMSNRTSMDMYLNSDSRYPWILTNLGRPFWHCWDKKGLLMTHIPIFEEWQTGVTKQLLRHYDARTLVYFCTNFSNLYLLFWLWFIRYQSLSAVLIANWLHECNNISW